MGSFVKALSCLLKFYRWTVIILLQVPRKVLNQTTNNIVQQQSYFSQIRLTKFNVVSLIKFLVLDLIDCSLLSKNNICSLNWNKDSLEIVICKIILMNKKRGLKWLYFYYFKATTKEKAFLDGFSV